MKFMQLLRIIRAHSWLITLTILLAWLLAAVITGTTTPRYTATSSVLIDIGESQVRLNPSAPSLPHTSYLATQLDLIGSQSVALKVIDRLHIADDPRAQARFLGSESSLREKVGRWKAQAIAFINSLRGASSAPDSADDQGNERFRLADRFLSKANVRPSPDSNVLHVAYTADTGTAAAEAANAIVKAFADTTLELNVSPARVSSEWLDAQVERLAKDVQVARAKFSDFQQRSGIVGEAGADDESVRLTDLHAQLVAAQSQNHPAIQALKSDVARAQAKLNELPPQLGPNHPTYKRAQSEVATLRAHLEEESEQLAQQLQREIANQKSSMLQMKRGHAELATLKDAVATAQQALDDAAQRANQAKMNSEVTQPNVSIVRVAAAPRQPTAPNPLFNFALATVIGVALGIGLALWREVVHRYVRSGDDLREFLGVQVLGVLHGGPRSTSGRAGSLLTQAGQSPLLTMNR